ncbi:MAG: NAD(P)-binding domain-containing protein, partial [Clostridia bacterium]|nr:NAD(P)-binding domain-containing protein [Clostridia bacterium]
MLNKGIVFIGGGNMAEGIIRGMVNNQVADSANIRVYDVIQERMDYLNDTYGVVPVTDIKAAVKGCDIIFIAVRPQDIESVSARIKDDITTDKVIVSICAGIDLKKLADLFGSQSRLARVMPNTLIEARHGFSGIYIGENRGEEDKAIVSAVFSAIGQTMSLNESLFNVFTAYS